MYVYEIDLLTTFILFEDFLLLLYGFWPYSQRRAIVVFMYNLFETFSHFVVQMQEQIVRLQMFEKTSIKPRQSDIT